MKNFSEKFVLLMIVIDVFVLVKFEEFCHWTQRWFGIASPSWERLFIVIQLIATFKLKYALHGPVNIFFTGTLAAYAVCRFIWSLRRRPSSGSTRTLNKNKVTQHFTRILNLMVVWWPPVMVWHVAFTISMYFAACDDDPPGESKVKQWLSSFRSAPSLQPAYSERNAR